MQHRNTFRNILVRQEKMEFILVFLFFSLKNILGLMARGYRLGAMKEDGRHPRQATEFGSVSQEISSREFFKEKIVHFVYLVTVTYGEKKASSSSLITKQKPFISKSYPQFSQLFREVALLARYISLAMMRC